MAKNKKAKKNVSKASVNKAIRTLSHPVLKANYGSQSSKQLLAISPLKKKSSFDEASKETVTNNDRAEDDGIDHSLTREPINLGVKNVRQILSCVKEATLEVKDLILNECNIIYECKICTNLFRSLANFIAHKRIYCKKHFCEQMVLFDSTHFQFNEEDDDCPENEGEDDEPLTEANETSKSQALDPNEATTSSGPDIVSPNPSSTNSSVENTNPCDGDQSVVSTKRKFIEECVKKSDDQKHKQEDTDHLEMHLTTIKGNPNAVFQNIQISANVDHNSQPLTTEVNKKNYILNLFKEAKSLAANESQAIKRQRIEDILPPVDTTNDQYDQESSDNQLKCDICDSIFTSSKTLKVHTKTIHSSNRIVYPCPLCSLAFKQLSNATRHLIQIHKRTKTQANSLREVLKRRAYSTNSSENSSEVEDASDEETKCKTSLQSNSRKPCESTKAKANSRSSHSGCDNSKSSEKQSSRTTYACVYNCGNTFNWAPAKRSHEKSCRMRLEDRMDTPDTPDDETSAEQTNGSSHLTILSRDQCTNSQELATNLVLPESVKEKVKEFADLKSLRCTQCPTQDFMNRSQLLQHAVTHIGHSIYKCHGCSYQSIYENDMKYHLMNNHNINEEMISKHYQTLPNLTHPRLLIHPIKSCKANTSDSSGQSDSSPSPDKNTKLKIHLRTMGNTSKKCYEIVDK